MSRIRILVVDDSAVVRKLLSDTLRADPELQIIGTASDGRTAISKVETLKPDVVTLDVEMPVMNGLEALRALRTLHPRLPIIMFSTLTERGALATLDALSLGASDYVTKPANAASIEAAVASVRRDLIPKIRALVSQRMKEAPAASIKKPAPVPRLQLPIGIVAIGTSTGGPNALAELLPRIPKTFPVPIVIVQHMPPIFTRFLAERLAKGCELQLAEAQAGAELLPGQAWIAPGDFHLTVARAGLRARLELNQGPHEHSCRPAVDVLFRSVAATYGARALGVVMTGMGKDGVLGAQQIRESGGAILVQDQASSVVWGMPGLVHEAGYDDGVYPLDQLAGEITRRVLQSRSQALSPVPFAMSASQTS
jgi:two-component system chemotaxis response regulator CheB